MRKAFALGLVVVLALSMCLIGQTKIQLVGKVTVTTAGTRVQLSSTLTRARGIYIEADEDNTGVIFIGGSTVSGDSYIAALNAGEGFTWTADQGGPALDPSSIYIDSDANTQSVQWGYY